MVKLNVKSPSLEAELKKWKRCWSARVMDEWVGNPVHSCYWCKDYSEYEMLNTMSKLDEKHKYECENDYKCF